MIETINVEVDGMKFSIQQFPARKCMKLEKRTIAILVPIFNMLDSDQKETIKKNVKNKKKKEDILDMDIDFSKLVSAIQEILNNLSDDAFEAYISDMLNNVIVEEKGQAPAQLTMEKFDNIFVGKSLTVYKLLVEVMRANKFAFFELMGGGWSKISMLSNPIK